MDLFSHVDKYCERTGAGLLSEPLNLFSNLLFIVVALFLLKKYGNDCRHHNLKFLLWLVFCVGIGSALFHSFANNLTLILDVVPIGIFLCFYVKVFSDFIYFRWQDKLQFFGEFIIYTVALSILVPGEAVNGSNYYLGSLLFLISLTLKTLPIYKPASAKLLRSALLFGVSLVFRSIDRIICKELSFGTHFLWHAGNAGAIYFALEGLILFTKNQKFKDPGQAG